MTAPRQSATLADVQQILPVIERLAARYGFIVALYGSVLTRGIGQDIDLLMVPKRPAYSIEDCAKDLGASLSATLVGEIYHGLMQSHSYLYGLPGGVLLDIQFREQALCRDQDDDAARDFREEAC